MSGKGNGTQGEGESDAVITNGVDESTNYQSELTAFIKDVRLTYGANLPFVIGELSAYQTGTGPAAQRNNIRAAQIAVASALPDTGIVNTDSFPLNSDSLHFSTSGQEALGYGFATQMQDLVSAPEPPAVWLALAGGAVMVILGRHARRRAQA